MSEAILEDQNNSTNITSVTFLPVVNLTNTNENETVTYNKSGNVALEDNETRLEVTSTEVPSTTTTTTTPPFAENNNVDARVDKDLRPWKPIWYSTPKWRPHFWWSTTAKPKVKTAPPLGRIVRKRFRKRYQINAVQHENVKESNSISGTDLSNSLTDIVHSGNMQMPKSVIQEDERKRTFKKKYRLIKDKSTQLHIGNKGIWIF